MTTEYPKLGVNSILDFGFCGESRVLVVVIFNRRLSTLEQLSLGLMQSQALAHKTPPQLFRALRAKKTIFRRLSFRTAHPSSPQVEIGWETRTTCNRVEYVYLGMRCSQVFTRELTVLLAPRELLVRVRR